MKERGADVFNNVYKLKVKDFNILIKDFNILIKEDKCHMKRGD